MTPAVVVAERPRRVDFLWGFLTVAFGAALVRGHLGAGTATSRLVIDAVFGTLVGGSIAAWIWFRRHPARLEVTPETVAFSHRGQPNATTLAGPGELYISTTYLGGKNRLQFLKVTGSEAAIPMGMFDHEEVKAACRANGWSFAGDGGP